MITVYGELYSSKNSKRIFKTRDGRPFIAKSKVSMQNESDLLIQLPLYRRQFLAECQKHQKPYRVNFKIYRKTRRRFDYPNIIQNLLDCMVKSGWLVDDNADEIIPVYDPYEVDKNNPRVEISVIGGGNG